ncbi:MAG: Replication initiator protein A (RepA) N-terminus [Bacteriophage sp.]|nr:MAG: Replication initiator protein A (RepA) N-terminus [Bacteriophage sp.]
MKKHILDIGVAQLVGANAALILENISYWCEHNAANNSNLHDGHYWTYNSTKAFGELFPYMTINVIRASLKKLKDNGLILTGNYNKSAYDRTMWYTLTEKAETMLDVNVHSDDPNQEEATEEAPSPAPTTAQDPWGNTTNANTKQFQTPAYEPQPLLAEPEPKPQPKKTRKAKSFDAIIDNYTNDPKTKELLGQWLQNRKAKRAAMTDGAIKGNIDILDRLAQESRMNVNDYLSEVVRRGWTAFFAINNYQRTGTQQQQKPQQQNPWYDTPEAQRQYENDIKEWEEHCVFRL